MFQAALAIAAFLVVGLQPQMSNAQTGAREVTFTRDVAPVLHAKCVNCHRPGEVAPMALRTFEEARPWARAIKERVVSRKMPPWFANRSVGHFANDPSLSDEEIATIASWVDSGAPQGDPADMPTPPRFSDGWQLGEPDHIIDLPRVEVAADGGDSFPSFTVTLDLPQDRWVRAIEIQPSNREVAHHASLLTIGGPNGSGGGQFAGRAVGTPPIVYPDGTGRWVRKGQILRADLHYHSNGTATTDQTRVGLYFGHGELKKEVVAALVGNQMFEIPPHTNNHEVRAGYIVDQDITLLWLAAHMHLRGKDMDVTAYFPDGRRQTLLSVGAYDFNWQLSYHPKERITLPRGTRIEVVAHYDNSTANRANPDPTRAIAFGLGVTDEMMYSPFEFVSDAGVSPTPSSVQSRMAALLSIQPMESSFLVDVEMGKPVPSVLHLPRKGDGTWYLELPPFDLPAPQMLIVPIRQVRWSGDSFEFSAEFQSGEASTVTGTIGRDGSIRGAVRWVAGGQPLPFANFTGARRQ